jgi:hypothetical protein
MALRNYLANGELFGGVNSIKILFVFSVGVN